MKALTCEMCGSTNILKDEGVFVCQACGTKYSVEEAKKMMIDGTVEVAGTVKIDTSSELTNLYEIARRAKETNNSENALKYYDMILVKDPSSWEANFYVVYFKAMSCKIIEIQSAAISVSNCIDSVLDLVKENVSDPKEQQDIILELDLRLRVISEMLYNGAKNHYDEIDASIKTDYTQEYVYNVFAATDIMYIFGDSLIIVFEDTYGVVAAEAWKKGIIMHSGFMGVLQDKESNKNAINLYVDKIKKYDPSYQAPTINTSSGCYIATAVYGSYDCPEVWTLRRFRDNTLANSLFGRVFIRVYYAISPVLVKWFGKTKWFVNMWRFALNKMISKLNEKGLENTPYHGQ